MAVDVKESTELPSDCSNMYQVGKGTTENEFVVSKSYSDATVDNEPAMEDASLASHETKEGDGSALPSTYTVNVPKQGRCRDLIQMLGNVCSLKQNEELKIAEIQNHLIQRFIDDPLRSLSTIKDDDHLAAYKNCKIFSLELSTNWGQITWTT